MDYQCRASIPDLALLTFEQTFEIGYAHNSTAIEGNTLSLIRKTFHYVNKMDQSTTLQ